MSADASADGAEDLRTTATGLARYAFEYIEAAELVAVTADDKAPHRLTPFPAYFLAHHGIELCLKAYLRHSGISVRQLRSKTFGHDLYACYRKAKELGLLTVFKEHADDVDALKLLVAMNEGHGLRYIRTGYKTIPLWGSVLALAVRLHQSVAPLAGYKSFTRTFSTYG